MRTINQKDENYPTRLLKIQSPPKKLYVEGDSSLLNQNSIAIVGSRKATEYGKKQAQIFSKHIAKKGITVVSGMAVGIDSIAHIYSMEELGKTIAVLGSGFNNIFPKENYYLYQKILENDGCIISEYPPEEKVNMENFPRRNRIISGLSMGVLIVEARKLSGSTITARHAMKQKKEVFCIPNQIDKLTGCGTNELIKNGANLVTNPQDILDFYGFEIEENTPEKIEKYKEFYEVIGQLPISANEIARLTNKTISQTTESLCMLELEGVIKQVAGNKYVRVN